MPRFFSYVRNVTLPEVEKASAAAAATFAAVWFPDPEDELFDYKLRELSVWDEALFQAMISAARTLLVHGRFPAGTDWDAVFHDQIDATVSLITQRGPQAIGDLGLSGTQRKVFAEQRVAALKALQRIYDFRD